MANRFPLIFNSGAGQIQELAASDNLDLTSSNLVNAGILFTSSGSQTAPSLQIGSGTTYNPGLYSPGTDQLSISTSGTGRMFVDSVGKIGIGAASVAGLLQIKYATDVHTSFRNATAGGLSAGTLIESVNDAFNSYNPIYLKGSQFAFGTDSAGSFVERLRITSTGALNFVGAGAAGSTQAVSFNGSAPVNSLVIDSNGRLGIGTNAPGYLIHARVSRTSGANATALVLSDNVTGAQTSLFGTRIEGHSNSGTAKSAIGFEAFGGTNNDTGISFYTQSTAGGLTRQMIIDSIGRVGIGVTSPGAIFQAKVATNYNIAFNTDNNGVGRITCVNDAFNAASSLSVSGADLRLQISGQEKARLDSSGRLLIGTSTERVAGQDLVPYAANAGDITLERSDIAGLNIISNRSDQIGAALRFGKSTGDAVGSNAIVANDNRLGTIQFCGADGTDMVSVGAQIEALVDGTPGANDMPGRIVLSTTASGASSPTERMRITSGGDLLVNTTTSSVSNPGTILAVGGQSFFSVAASTSATNTLHVYSSTASAYRFYVGMDGTVNATNTTISAISDQRFKENIRDLDVGLNQILALQPRRFDWKENKGKNIQNDRGFIAQEFEQVFPDMVGEWIDPAPEGEEPYKSVRADLIPVLVKAIQEQQAIINGLEARLAALEAS